MEVSGVVLARRLWGTIRFALRQTGDALKERLPQTERILEAEYQPIYARSTRVRRHPVPRAAAIRQSHQRWFSTQSVKASIRHLSSSTGNASKYDRSTFPTSNISRAVTSFTGRAPFASTLRPNLTGGALPRSAGGYGSGAGRIGGARYFSHSPAAPAQVINNVSQGVRAFWLSGQKAQFDGMSARKEKQFKSVTLTQEKASRKLRSLPALAPGSYVDFNVAPTITAIGPLGTVSCDSFVEQGSLNTASVMDTISIDFARAFKDLAIVMKDLKNLALLGDLPLALVNDGSAIRVRFPGCDADTVHRLCQELGIRRGLVHQDEDFDITNGTEMALLFPFAPSRSPSDVPLSPGARGTLHNSEAVDWQHMLSPQKRQSSGHSTASTPSHDFEQVEVVKDSPGLTTLSDLTGFREDGEFIEAASSEGEGDMAPDSLQYEGLEGIYRFLEECDRARR